jgi:hypothetical protein
MIISAVEKRFSTILLRDYPKNTTHLSPPVLKFTWFIV